MDPHDSWWIKLLGLFRLVRRGCFVVVHQHKPIMCTHPDNVESLKKYLAAQGYGYTVAPLLTSVDGGAE